MVALFLDDNKTNDDGVYAFVDCSRKRAYYVRGSAQSFWKLWQNFARFSELYFSHLNYAAWFLIEIKAEHRVITTVRRGGHHL